MSFGVFVVVFLVTHYVSLGSLSAAVAFPLTMFFRENVFMVDVEGYGTLIFFSIGISLLIIFTHRSNIRRLLRGTENRITSVPLFRQEGRSRLARRLTHYSTLMRIAVLGAGSWGTTLAILLSENSHQVTLWSFRESRRSTIRRTRENPAFLPGDPIPSAIAVTSDLAEAVDGREMIVAAVPSQFLRSVIWRSFAAVPLGRRYDRQCRQRDRKRDADDDVGDDSATCFPGCPRGSVATLSGPSHAEEVSRKIPTTVVAASTQHGNRAKVVQSAFMVPYFRVYASNDLRGVELGGALKNVIAIAAGIIDGAELGDNTKAAVMTRGIAEIARIGVALGAQAADLRRALRHRRSDGHLHEPAQPEPARRRGDREGTEAAGDPGRDGDGRRRV